MRIGIDARFFGPRQTGLGRYVERLITHLQRIDDHNEYVIFLRRESFDSWSPTNPRWKKVLADYHWYTFAEQLALPGVCMRENLDVLHVPHFNVPVLYPRKFIVTIHDLILDQFPTERASTLEPILFWIKFMAYKFGVWNAIHRAARIITVSEHSRQDVMKRFGVKPEKVSVTYESVDPLAPPVDVQYIKDRGVKPPYVLHVGNSYPHKNLERLLEAWKLFQSRKPGGQLVLAGHRDFFSKRLENFAKAKSIPNVRWYGFATEEELSRLYRSAQAYVFPSLSEGFGLPGLEAMSVNTPVFSARASCLPEVFADAAEYFDPHSTAGIATALDQAMYNMNMNETLSERGQRRIADFSWERMARQTLDLYEHVA